MLLGTFELPILNAPSKVTFSIKKASSFSLCLKENEVIKQSTLTIQNLVFIPFEYIIIPNQNHPSHKWNQSKMNVFYRTKNDLFFETIKFRNHPVTIGQNPANDSVVVVPFRSVIFKML